MNKNIKGLREQIAAAATHEEIEDLLKFGQENHPLASLKTVRQWRVTAARRRVELAKSVKMEAR